MPRQSVQVEGHVAATPAAVWAIARNFCGTWHPAIATIAAERGADGSLVRRFTVHGEATIYRERLFYFSDSDRTLGYSHLEGIRGAEQYAGWFAVSPARDGGSKIAWSAEISAADGRLQEIASGTEFVFRAGIAALAGMDLSKPLATADMTETKPASGGRSETIVLAGTPRIALDVTEAQDGPLCLFLHGIGGGRGNWTGQMAAIRGILRGAAMDLRGYGGSALGPAPSTVDDYCSDILRVMAACGAARIVLCGLSYGAWLATSFALHHPEKVAGLVLSGGCTGMSEAGEDERRAFRESREVPLQQGKTPADFAPAVVDAIAGPDAPEAVRVELLRSISAIPVATYRDALHCFTRPPERFDFARLGMPVLLMTGEHDRLASPGEIRTVARRIAAAAPAPNVRFEIVPGAGHVCNLEAPAEYNRLLTEFLHELMR